MWAVSSSKWPCLVKQVYPNSGICGLPMPACLSAQAWQLCSGRKGGWHVGPLSHSATLELCIAVMSNVLVLVRQQLQLKFVCASNLIVSSEFNLLLKKIVVFINFP